MSGRPERLARAAFGIFRAIPTRWHDNDVYGHVNNVVYYSWFDTAVNAWLVERSFLDIVGSRPLGSSSRRAAPISRAWPFRRRSNWDSASSGSAPAR